VKKKLLALLGLVVGFSLIIYNTPLTRASFNPHNIMNDAVFNNTSSMSAEAIQNFLNQFPSSCLRNYSAPYPYHYFSYGGNVSAATVIRRAADLWGINPQVILATLQKESSVVTGTASYGCAYMNTAMGFNCPDSGACPVDPANAGFSQQVTKGSWLLKVATERSVGNINWDPPLDPDDDRNYYYSGPMTQGYRQRRYDAPVQYYDGVQPIDGQSVSMGSGSTASFYFYTPHLSGNLNFVNIFESWFGSTQTTIPYAWMLESQEAYIDSARTKPFTSQTTVTPGAKIYLTIKARNIGNQTWTPSFLRLGTSGPGDRLSGLKDVSWLAETRPTALLEGSVGPGQTGTFNFILSAPGASGSSTEYFNLVADGHVWLNDIGLYYDINIVNPSQPKSTNAELSLDEAILVNEHLLSNDTQSILRLQSDGNVVLYRNFNQVVWNTSTQSTKPNRLIMQTDGNLVLYNQAGTAIWNTGTQGNTGARLVLQTDGNLVIYSQANTPIWSINKVHNPDLLNYVNTTLYGKVLYPNQSLDTADRRYKLALQTDGNLVVYSPSRAIWSSVTLGGYAATRLALQTDGNLVLYNNAGQSVWHSGTYGKGPARLTIQPDGNLVLYNGLNEVLWYSNTAGQQ